MALENWLNRNVETEQYRSRVRCVALGLGDLKAYGSYEVHWDGYGQYDYVAADAVRAVPWSAWGSLGRIFGK